MARTTFVKKAQQRYATVPVIDPATGEQKVTPVIGRNGEQKTTKAGKPVVLRVTQADKSQPLPNEKCERCGKEITPGSPYKWIAPKSGPYGGHKRTRCAECPGWRPSETTSSTIKSIVYGAQENFSDELMGIEDIESLVDAVHTVGESYREAGEAARESATNIEDGFGHATYQSDELNERADSLESAADELENWEPSNEVDEDACRTEAEEEILDELRSEYEGDESITDLDELKAALGDAWDEDDYTARVDERTQEKLNELVQEAKDEADSAVTDNVEE